MFFRAKLASFYGWTHDYINGLEYEVALEYYEAITVIEAQGNLVDMNLADYPQMKKDGRTKLYRSMRKMAEPQEMRKEMDFDDFFKAMGHGE